MEEWKNGRMEEWKRRLRDSGNVSAVIFSSKSKLKTIPLDN
jgi:ribosomal protein L25 (general stress protein Ctc)